MALTGPSIPSVRRALDLGAGSSRRDVRAGALHRGTAVWTLPPLPRSGMTLTWSKNGAEDAHVSLSPSPSWHQRASGRGNRGDGSGEHSDPMWWLHGASASSRFLMHTLASNGAPEDDSLPSLVTASTSNPPVTGGPIITPKRNPKLLTVNDGPDLSAERRARWNTWWMGALEANNVEAIKMCFEMPWADAGMIVSSMRAINEPRTFQAVVLLLAERRKGELETKEHVGGLTALAWAAKRGDARSIETLVTYGAVVDARDNGGATPLLHAVVADATPAVECLLGFGADPNARASGGGSGGRRRDAGDDSPVSEDGWSPLGWAARKGQLGSIRLLLTHGADVNARGGGGGSTPLIQAAMGGHLKAVQELVSAGAVDTRDESGFTAAMHAGFRHPQNAQLLGAVAEASSVSIGG